MRPLYYLIPPENFIIKPIQHYVLVWFHLQCWSGRSILFVYPSLVYWDLCRNDFWRYNGSIYCVFFPLQTPCLSGGLHAMLICSSPFTTGINNCLSSRTATKSFFIGSFTSFRCYTPLPTIFLHSFFLSIGISSIASLGVDAAFSTARLAVRV